MVANSQLNLTYLVVISRLLFTLPKKYQEWICVVIKKTTATTSVYGIKSVPDLDSSIAVPSEATQCDRDFDVRDCTIHLGEHDIKPCPSYASLRSQHACKTQPPLHVSLQSLYIGKDNVASRFARDSVITFSINYDSFPNSEYSKHAAKSLERAANAWNQGQLGVVFRKVSRNKPAVFQLVYSNTNGGRSDWLAESFFPNETLEEQQPQLYVFWPAFHPHHYHNMFNVFCHELGHILGARHGHARTDEEEAKISSVEIGDYDASSVMNYRDDLSLTRIQKSDHDSVRGFYALDCEYYDNFRVKTINPREFDPLSHDWQLV
ncbi:hypothetical protein GGR53DRAFT_485033 [Hypoxylon sp. FL1150]|nr:hypothetical protein GGR53DRAFT_485033 [Hypoxylon sp. FL1150]